RLDLRGKTASQKNHLELYNEVDLALDSFPYNGTTTSCESFWMGVPMVSLAGTTHVSRVGVSLLNNIGLPELDAEDLADYVETAVRMAGDVPRLAQIRAGMRERMRQSPLMNGPQFVRNVESAYRTMWLKWIQR